MQGFALCASVLATTQIRQSDAPAWMEISVRTVLLVSAALFFAGVLMTVARRVPDAREDSRAQSAGAWPPLLWFSLLALPMLAYVAAHDLVPLWNEIAVMLEEIGFWQALSRPDPFGGIVILPILAGLFVPILETAAAFFLIVMPAASVILLFVRSTRFPMIFTMMVACQLGLVIASVMAADGISRLATEVIAAMTAADDAGVRGAADLLSRAESTLVTTARALVPPALGYMAWLPFLLRSRAPLRSALDPA